MPPNQARKLSRTLSMQAHGRVPCVFKRSLSSGRDTLESEPSTYVSSAATSIPTVNTSKSTSKCDDNDKVNDPSSLLLFDRNSVLRRSMSRSRDQSALHRRSISAIRSEFPSRLSYTGDLRSDYSSTKVNDSKANRYRLTDYTSIIKPEYYSKLPLPSFTSKNHAPQESPSNHCIESSMRDVGTSQRGSGRFLKRPDLYGSSSSINGMDEKHISKPKQDHEHETQKVLREIRERNHDRSCAVLDRTDTQSHNIESQLPVQKRIYQRNSSISNIQNDNQNEHVHHTRTKSAQSCCDVDNSTTLSNVIDSKIAADQKSDQSSFSREGVEKSEIQSAAEFTDEILGELIRRSNEYRPGSSDLSKNDEKTIESCSLKKPKTKSRDNGKKLKAKQKSAEYDDRLANDSFDERKPITQDDVQSVTLPLPKSSKIARRMSQPQKDDSNNVINLSADKKTEEESKEQNGVKPKSSEANLLTADIKLYPNSKLTPPKDVTLKAQKASTSNATSSSNARNAITAVMEKIMEKSTERLSPGKSITVDKTKSDAVGGESSDSKPKLKKKVKVVKRLIQNDQQIPPENKEIAQKSNEISNTKETKSPEKKIKSGFLYSIGQKFEKMRENSKNKEKEKKNVKSNETTTNVTPTTSTEPCKSESENIQTIIIPHIVKDRDGKIIQNEEITIRKIDSIPKIDQNRSRIDAVIRNLRERSVPHTNRAGNLNSDLATESGLLKRAVSVEDMSNGMNNCNKGNINKVLGLFKRIEKEQQVQKQQSLLVNQSELKATERPNSGGSVSKIKKSNRPYYTGAKSDTIVTLTDQFERQYLNEKGNHTSSKIPFLKSIGNTGSIANGTDGKEPRFSYYEEKKQKSAEPYDEMQQMSLVNDEHKHTNNKISEKERIRNNRKGLVLDLTNEQYDDHFKRKITTDCSSSSSSNNNNNNQNNFNSIDKRYSNKCDGLISNENQVNNNFTGNGNYYPCYAHSHLHSHAHSHSHGHFDRTNEQLTPSYEMNASYSSDNRSLRDDCESTSTFLSPTEEQELSAFDNWSACSGK